MTRGARSIFSEELPSPFIDFIIAATRFKSRMT
jgi:hypothetical protein